MTMWKRASAGLSSEKLKAMEAKYLVSVLRGEGPHPEVQLVVIRVRPLSDKDDTGDGDLMVMFFSTRQLADFMDRLASAADELGWLSDGPAIKIDA